MSPEKFHVLMDLFQRALQVEGEERRRFIHEHAGADLELRAELEALLGEPAAGAARLVTAGGLEAVRRNLSANAASDAASSPATPPPAPPAPPAPPVLSGNYRLLGVLGEGGMGIVYQAEQAFPRRTVALKAMRPGFVSRGLLQRFHNEAQILARLQHPGIAQIYEAGAADPDSPDQAFFVMEFVNGRPLTDYALERSLSVDDRLELMARVCDAVQHAHQRGIIHRDLKPSNILVDVAADPPQPKILDFGVARATDGDLRAATLQTSVGQLVGTLPYMSPEQVAADPDAIDTRTDVYALGVILYQLLVGRLPFDLSARSLPDAVRVIRDEMPSRLGTLDRSLRGDLDTIVAKALEKDKARRYQSAAELGDDLRRYIAGEPIAAKRDSIGYMLQKRVRRYRWAMTVSGLFALTLAGFLVYSILQARELADRLSIANVERGRALAESGSLSAAGEVLWREFLQRPDSPRTRWALREYYERHPVLCTLPDSSVQPIDIAASPDGRRLAVTGIRGRAGLYPIDLSAKAWESKPGELSVTSPFFTLDGRAVGMIVDAQRVDILDAGDGRLLRQIGRGLGMLRSCALSPDGRTLAITTLEGDVAVYDAGSGVQRLVRRLHGPRVVHVLEFSPDGASLLIGGSDRSLACWPLDLSRPRWRVTLDGRVSTLAGVDGGRTLAVGLGEPRLLWVSPESGEILGQTRCSAEAVSSIATLSGGRIAAGGAGFLDVIDIARREVVRTLKSDLSHDFTAVQGARDDLLVVGGVAASPQVWQIDPEASHRPIGLTPVEWTLGLSIADAGVPLLTADSSGGVQLWDPAARRALTPRTLVGPGTLRTGVISRDGREAFVGAANGSVQVLSGEDLSELRSLPCLDRSVAALDVSGDGQLITAAAFDGDAALWDARAGVRLREFGDVGQQVTYAKFSPDATRVVFSGYRPSVSLWDVHTGVQLAAVDNDSNSFATSFSPDGRWLACTGRLRRVDLLDATTLQLIRSLEGHSHVPVATAVSPDGLLVAASAADGVVRFWEAATGGALATIRLDTQEVSRLVFTPDGRHLIATGRRGRIWAYQLDYHDRSIAGNARFQAARQRDSIPRSTDTAAVIRWADSVLAGPPSAEPQHPGRRTVP